MSDFDPAAVLRQVRPVPTARSIPDGAPGLEGWALDGSPIRLGLSGADGGTPWALLLFLKVDCLGCAPLWGLVADPRRVDPSERVRVVALVRPEEDEAAVHRLAGESATVVAGNAPWSAYRVHGAPFMVLVDGAAGRVAAEDLAWGADAVVGSVQRHLLGDQEAKA